jgi:hypothetical protein
MCNPVSEKNSLWSGGCIAIYTHVYAPVHMKENKLNKSFLSFKRRRNGSAKNSELFYQVTQE